MGTRGDQLGRVMALWRYPVKSMAGQSLEQAEVSWHGLAGDRRWAFVRDGQVRSGFPWMTIRERSDMGAFTPSFTEPDRPDSSAVVVRTPSGAELDVTDPELAAELGHGSRLIKQNRGVFDAAPLSLISVATVRALGGWVGSELDPRRFRPNLLVDTGDDEPFAEEGWVGHTLRVGAMSMRVDRRDERCVIVNVDPETSERDPRVLKAIAKNRDACTGVYGTTVEPGVVVVGDAVSLGA
jgi:uncharacterized protein YcbX